MRKSALLIAGLAAAFASAPAAGQPPRGSQEAFRGVRQGDMLPLHVIRSRVRIPGAQLIAVDLIGDGAVYRLRFMRGRDTAIVDVDARTGQPMSCRATHPNMCR